ncbi:MAG: ABC transporter ATP-binding protein [Oscillospiraceae bacterium]|nr:ABC transporter ATP-binding protein [Oscillospiraceae bacterium]
MIKMTDINVTLGKKHILKNIDLNIKPHTITAVIGKNGSGKSTLVSAINGTVNYTGQMLFAGQDIRILPQREKAKLISVLPQALSTPHITVEELVKMGRNPYVDIGKRFTPQDTQAVSDAMAAMGITDMKYRYLDCISGGERQKAYLAMILAQHTRLMVLDEPATYMDMAYECQFMETLTALQKTLHKTVVVVMHNLSTAVKYANRIVVMDGGTVAFEGATQDCLEAQIIEKTFGVKKHISDGEIFFS